MTNEDAAVLERLADSARAALHVLERELPRGLVLGWWYGTLGSIIKKCYQLLGGDPNEPV